MAVMKTVDEVRRINLKKIANELGSQAALCKKLGKSQGQVSGLMNGVKDSVTGKRRGMHDSTARHIESACGKPRGWLDVDHDNQQPPELEEVLRRFPKASAERQKIILDLLRSDSAQEN